MVVGIGASAGGLKALEQFVEAIPVDSGSAYVVILHLDPARESRICELLQDQSRIPVVQVNKTTTLVANHIYVIPPEQDLVVRGHTLELQERGERGEHAPVDLLFRTLAESYGADGAGVVLSGTGADGTAGVRYIREAGGITIAQLPEESEYDGMPSSAITTGLVDLILRAGAMPAELQRVRHSPARLGNGGASEGELEAGLARLFTTLRTSTGHDFSMYKRSTVLRRLERRLRFNETPNLEAYQSLLETSTTESQALLRDLLISVSSFFRDADAFEALAAAAPAMFEGKTSADTVRVWVVGCATGEEVYSIAMVLTEYASTLSDPPRLQLFATDIDEHGYAWARAGLYSAAAVASVPRERLRRFFTKEAGGYRVAKSLRELVLFAGHNVLHDPPFSRMDLVSCRNLFIYLQPDAQARILETFHFALNPDGMLFLGASESTGDSSLFVASGAGPRRLYRRNSSTYRVLPRLSSADPVAGGARPLVQNGPAAPAGEGERFSYGALHVRMLEQYTATSVIVDERLEVLHLSAGAGRFLQLSEGEPSHNLLGLAREDLRRVLRTALHHAFDKGTTTTRRVRMEVDGAMRDVSVRVRPAPERADSGVRYALVVFDMEEATGSARGAAAQSAGASTAEVELEEELARTRELLDTTSTAHDRTVAELQAVNEELQSINEEQRAATEELETGREEIQSINEELTTINQEHQSTIEELKRTNADLQNLIESTEIGTIFLDRAMRLRRFTPAACKIFNFLPTDQGRPLAHITHHLKYDAFAADIERVCNTHEPIEREVESDAGESYIVRITPYRSPDGTNEGAVLTFYDNTAQHRARQELEEATLAAEAANLAKSTFLSTLSHEFRTPLNAVLGYADLLALDGPLNQAQLAKVERIRIGGWHLASMIEEILSVAKLDSGHEVVMPQDLDARGIAQDACGLVEPAAQAKGLELVCELPDAEVAIVTDEGKARQILINLCGNAIKYTERGSIHLSVHADDDRVHFEVRDTGIGIAPEHHAKIFERFWQVDGCATRAGGGMGIGLAAARGYARLLGGDVVVESRLGEGTMFRLSLPRLYTA